MAMVMVGEGVEVGSLFFRVTGELGPGGEEAEILRRGGVWVRVDNGKLVGKLDGEVGIEA